MASTSKTNTGLSPPLRGQTEGLGPGIGGALSFAVSDVLAKVTIAAGSSVLTMVTFRSFVGLAFMAVWLSISKSSPMQARERWIAMAVGVLLAALVFCLFKAIEVIDVPTAILTYFIYPLLTGLAASAAGLERLRWQGLLCALVAFCGLGLMIGAHPAGLALVGIVYALFAAVCRTGILLATRAYLVDADPRLTTWYSLVSSTVLYTLCSLGTLAWQPPQTTVGWTAIFGMSVAITAGILLVFVSTVRIGAFRTALIMNVEPLVVMVLSAILLGELITPLQGVGSAIMLAALVAFQLWR
jgi:drug/metabolite transporter (DMT)-like permease